MGSIRALPVTTNNIEQNSSKSNKNNINSTDSSLTNSSSSLLSPGDWSERFHASVVCFYRCWAKFVVSHPVKIIIFCFLLTAICSMKMATTKRKNNIRGYTPYGARALNEFDVRDQFFGQSGTGIRFFILVLPKKGNNMLDEKVLRETLEVDSLVQNNLTIFNKVSRRDEPFSVICRRFCTINEPVRYFYIGWKDQMERLRKKEPLNGRTLLNYPISSIFGKEVNIQPNFFGIHFGNSGGASRNFTNMLSAEMIVLLYRAERIGGWSDEEIFDYEMSVSNFFKNNYEGDHIRVLTISSTYAQVEVDRSGKILRSYVSVGLVVMTICSLLSNSISAAFMRQFSVYKLPVALFACLCPLMASGTALGLLFFAGVRHGSILGLTPFLILAIGIDDAFLMIHSWQMVTSRRRRNKSSMAAVSGVNADFEQGEEQKINETIVHQLAEVLEDTGPAVMISALTNISSDIIGSFTGSPEITLLCIGNIASILVDFFYQITLFTAVLVICARFELRAETRKYAIAACNTINQQNIMEKGIDKKETKTENRNGFRDRLEAAFGKFSSAYVRFVSNIWAALLICLVWLAVMLFCINAMLKFEINLTTKKLFPPDSPLLEIENYREDKVLPCYTTAQLFINNPGDLSNNTRRHRLDAMIEEMERLPYAYPAESSMYFVRNYESFESVMGEQAEMEPEEEETGILSAADEVAKMNLTGVSARANEVVPTTSTHNSFDLSDLEAFLNWPEYMHWRGLINYHNVNSTNGQRQQSTPKLDSFMATVAYHGDELKEWHRRAVTLNQWRNVVDKYGEFNVTVLHDDGLYLDLLENMPTDIWQSAVATLLCMAGICTLFMSSNFFVVCVTTGVIASICVETLGLLALMGMTMDPVVMAAVIISIGFSVDIPAHVSYHFHMAKWEKDNEGDYQQQQKSSRKTPRSVKERVQNAFSSVGFPALQASACTNICAITLLFLPLYMAQVFAKVLCTCITLGTIHSLLLLPALFTIVAQIESLVERCGSKKKGNTETEDQLRRKRSHSFKI